MSGPEIVAAALTTLTLVPFLDAAGRLLRLASNRPGLTGPGPFEPLANALVLVPARAEGLLVLGLAGDLAREARALSASGRRLHSIVLLDGEDPVVEARVRELGLEVLVKAPAGPTKGAVLAFATRQLDAAGRLQGFDFILVFDADMRLPDGYFRELRIPEGAQAFQAPVRPEGVPPAGAARVEALSLAVATLVEDVVRDGRALPVRLRGKAMGFTPAAWRLGPAATVTLAEDSEATLRLLSRGVRIRALSSPIAFDEPARVGEGQVAPRARWFAGHVQLVLVEGRALLRFALARPAQAAVLFADLFLRPRAFVLVFVLFVLVASLYGVFLVSPWFGVPLAVAALTLVCERVYVGAARARLGFGDELPPVSPRDFLSALLVWLRALVRAARRPGRWHRARPETRA